MKNRIQFKEPDLEFPKDWTERQAENFRKKYAEFGEYYLIEIDTATLACRLVPRDEWKQGDGR